MTRQKIRIRDAERSRAALLTAATQLFARHGYEGARIHTIADAAGVNKAMISYHFGGKRKLYEEVVIELISAVEPELREIRESKLPAEARLRTLLETLMRYAEANPAFPAIVLREHLSGGTRLSDRVLPHFLQFYETTRNVVEQGIQDGLFRKVDPHSVHLSLIGGLIFFQASRPMREQMRKKSRPGIHVPRVEEFMEHTEKLFLTGIRAVSSTTSKRQ